MYRDPLAHLTADELDALLSPGPPTDVESHIATCASCAALVALDRRVVESLAALPQYQPRGDLTDRVMARVTIGRPATIVTPRAHSARRRAIAIGAASAGALSTGFAWAVAYPATAVRWMALFRASGHGTWPEVHGLITNLAAQRWFDALRDNAAHPARAVAVLAAAAAIYGLGLAALERLLAAPVIDAGW
jgi:anti-sigma factor RsiW